jgi:hypothetical protein
LQIVVPADLPPALTRAITEVNMAKIPSSILAIEISGLRQI